jgi:hypothetical protein
MPGPRRHLRRLERQLRDHARAADALSAQQARLRLRAVLLDLTLAHCRALLAAGRALAGLRADGGGPGGGDGGGGSCGGGGGSAAPAPALMPLLEEVADSLAAAAPAAGGGGGGGSGSGSSARSGGGGGGGGGAFELGWSPAGVTTAAARGADVSLAGVNAAALRLLRASGRQLRRARRR